MNVAADVLVGRYSNRIFRRSVVSLFVLRVRACYNVRIDPSNYS